MEAASYHHGNLKNELIEAGIQLINQDGAENFSLRKVAMKCKVSHAAPYKHFKNKEQLLSEMKNFVISKFMDNLEAVVPSHESSSILVDLGIAYIGFFIDNPQYFYFLFSQEVFDLKITVTDGGLTHSDFGPFELFRKTAEEYMTKVELNQSSFSRNIITMWAAVHGLASIFATKHVEYSGDRNVFIREILEQNIVLN
ncbi:TetR/AcrR family transcriptional regulator [Sinanaerobacter chloroacetimidivorans]|uniref:TetR/AcrR family transcriptional regulator n=1 Tax=Sinanaerobacter chloroacetimidivorans TaxID=2818044 RepID=A0A8J7W3G7_9FIRM|nr:TetR/AcrR family transcriptional regulator [Sinanaerobacter chloroacetimidivorans]MBR0599809.1 TetR/AcrR family transcriptional regulator [Sinanaerobacter chloroacetimidivorans]